MAHDSWQIPIRYLPTVMSGGHLAEPVKSPGPWMPHQDGMIASG